MKYNFYFLIFIIPMIVSAQLNSTNYSSPTRGIVSSGGIIQSQVYNASGTILWFDLTSTASANFRQNGIGNLEILHGKSTDAVEENTVQTYGSSIFPNPLSEESVLQFFAFKTGEATLELFDITGITTYSKKINISTIGTNSFSLLEFYHRAGVGIYLLKLSFGGEYRTLKVLKL